MIQEENLMIGDWIKIVPFHDKKKSYFKRIDNARDLDIILDFQGFVEPIPITSEILKNNGFEQRKEEPDIYDCGGCISYTMSNRGYRIGGEDTCVVAHNKKYVHELQHALRLCKIDKEIIL